MKELKKNIIDKNVNVIFIYSAFSAFFISLAHVYVIVKPELLLNAPITGGLIVWVHLHTLGAITPLFLGIGFYNLTNRYNIQVKKTQILHQMLTLYIPLPFFLFLVINREGSIWLTLSAFVIFTSFAYYIFMYANALRKVEKGNRDFEFYTDAVSLYFLFQAVLFGFALAANLSFHFFRRDITHSIKLHSHSGILGFWLLQYLNMIYRVVKIGKKYNSSEFKSQNKFLKYAVVTLSVGIFLWTSVHDRFSWFFYVFYASVALTIFFLFLYFIGNKKNKSEENNTNISYRQIFNVQILMFFFMAFTLASVLIFSNSSNFIYSNHISLIYIYTVFYCIFIYVLIQFLAIKINENFKPSVNFYKKLKSAYVIYITFVIFFIMSIIFENILYMRLNQLFMLLDVWFISYIFYFEKNNVLVKSRGV
ncbi:MAG: hypothetical protein OEV78_04580 [Spirochaetia bacterium]|nr:hypothetical protein [Spirochaetia bacterium]